jgi:hypothetical protein
LKILISNSNNTRLQISQLSSDLSPQLDLSIEGMRSQEFSNWVFVFLVVGIIVFAGIVFAFLRNSDKAIKFRLGERLMFAAIILGLIAAVILGAMQMLGGYLF